MKRTLLTHGIWAFVAVGAFLLGRVELGSDPVADALAGSPPEDRGSLPSKGAARRFASAGAEGGCGGPRSALAMERAIKRVIVETDPIKRRRDFAEILESITPENAEGTLLAWLGERGARESWSSSVSSQYGMLTNAWGRVDGAAAMAYAEGLDLKMKQWTQGSVLSGWGYGNAQEALSWMEQNDRGNGPLIQQLLWGYAERDIDGATRYVLGRPDDVNAGVYIDRIARQRWSSGLEEASAWSDSLPEGALKERALDTIAALYSAKSPGDAAKWVVKYAGTESGATALGSVAEAMAETNPYGAMRWAAGLPEGKSRDRAIREAIGDFARRRPEMAGKYVAELEPGATRDTAVSVYSIRVIRENPVVAMEWAQSIDAVDLRHDTVVRGVQAWMRFDRPAADAWLESSGLPVEVVERIVPPPRDR